MDPAEERRLVAKQAQLKAEFLQILARPLTP